MTTNASTWLVLQLADSAFPAGGFIHSQGLETLYQRGDVRDEASLQRWLQALCWQSAHGFLPFLRAAYAAPESAIDVDALVDAFLLNHVANRASRQQGRALLGTASSAFGQDARAAPLHAFLQVTRAGHCAGHLPAALGVLCWALRLTDEEARRVALFWLVRGGLSAAVRLGVVGPVAAQRMQRDLAPTMEDAFAAEVELCDVAQTAPLLELAQMDHDRLYSRLFQS